MIRQRLRFRKTQRTGINKYHEKDISPWNFDEAPRYSELRSDFSNRFDQDLHEKGKRFTSLEISTRTSMRKRRDLINMNFQIKSRQFQQHKTKTIKPRAIDLQLDEEIIYDPSKKYKYDAYETTEKEKVYKDKKQKEMPMKVRILKKALEKISKKNSMEEEQETIILEGYSTQRQLPPVKEETYLYYPHIPKKMSIKDKSIISDF